MQITNAQAAAPAVPTITDDTDELTDDVTPEERLWEANYQVRRQYFEAEVGPLPNDILKMLNTTGVWPGGGLFVIPAPRLGADMAVYTTFGLSNPDMPTSVRMVDFSFAGVWGAGMTLDRKAPAPKRPGAAGYGYEMMVVAQAGLEWPLNALQWAVNAELAHDMGFLDRVERYAGMTVATVDVGLADPINILISKAQPPLPVGTQLPEGSMDLLVITTISESEMHWSMEHGRDKLLQRLQGAGKGQVSV